MRRRQIFLSAIAAALLFGLAVSGCNRDSSRTASRPANKNRQNQSVKPAEVLSASAYRPAPRRSEPLPPPSAVYSEAYAMAPASSVYAQPQPVQYVAATQPVNYYAASAGTPVPVSDLAPRNAPSAQSVQHTAVAMAPIPELEPARNYRLPTTRRASNRPVAEVMISERGTVRSDRQEVIRALAPIAATSAAPAAGNAAPASSGWVASPVTAMTGANGWY